MADGGDGRGLARLGFLAMCFAVLALTGMLAMHVAQLPLERAMAREAVLDRALVAARAGDAAALEGLRPLLGDSARVILPAGAEFEAAVAAERVAMRARLLAEAREVKVRMTAMLGLVALLAGGFGGVVMLAGRRVAPGGAVR
jgi:hypothetical protein